MPSGHCMVFLGSGKWMYFVLAGTRAGGSEVLAQLQDPVTDSKIA